MSIVISDLRKRFWNPDQSERVVLENVSFSIDKGDFLCIVGASGCGKTTILHILAGLTQADGGSIKEEDNENERLRVGYVFQEARLLNWLTVRENLRVALVPFHLQRREVDERIHHYIDTVGLFRYLDDYPLTLSGGMQQRVAIARALCIEPDLLLMDEPFSSLDEITAREQRENLLDIWSREAASIVFVTHNAMEATFLANRVCVLGGHPTSIQEVFTVDLPRPRYLEDTALLQIQKRIIARLFGTEA